MSYESRVMSQDLKISNFGFGHFLKNDNCKLIIATEGSL
jgi:hypothetical protein